MFNGLIREIARVKGFDGTNLDLLAAHKPRIGDSIAVNGACLTVTDVFSGGFRVQIARESKGILALENYARAVHIEPAMQLGERIDGHLLQGHVDCTGTILEIQEFADGREFFVEVDEKFMPFIAHKGFIAIDGVSLTINEVFKRSFRLTIIHHTFFNTLFASYTAKRRVNIETDLFARYAANILLRRDSFRDSLSWDAVEKIMSLY